MVLNDSSSASKRHRGDMFCRCCNQTVSKSTFYRHRLEHEASGQVQTKALTEQQNGVVINMDTSSDGLSLDDLTAEADEDMEEGILAL